jgi:hypothetical protein
MPWVEQGQALHPYGELAAASGQDHTLDPDAVPREERVELGVLLGAEHRLVDQELNRPGAVV